MSSIYYRIFGPEHFATNWLQLLGKLFFAAALWVCFFFSPFVFAWIFQSLMNHRILSLGYFIVSLSMNLGAVILGARIARRV